MPESLQSVKTAIDAVGGQTSAALLGILFLGFYVAWNLDPWRSLLAWIATTSVQFSAGSFHISVSDFFLLPLLLGTLLTWVGGRNRGVRFPTATLLFALLFLTVGNLVTAFTLGELPQWTWLNKDLGLLALLIPFWAMLTLCHDRSHTEKLFKTFLLSVSILNLIGLTLYVSSLFTGFGSFVNYGGMRFVGFMLDPNGYAGLAAVAAIIQVARLILKPATGLTSLLYLANSCALVAGCLLTLSRGGFLSLLAGGLILLLFAKGRSAYTIAFVLLAISIGMLELSANSDLNASIHKRADDRGNIDSRIDYMEQGMKMYLSSPLTLATGIGIGTFIAESPRFFGDAHQIHNTYVWLLVEGGPLIFGAYVLMLYRCLRQNLWIYRHAPQLRYAAAGCFCALVTTIVWCSTVEGTYHHHVWILLALSELFYSHSRSVPSIRQFQVRLSDPRRLYTPVPNEA
jgi:hypothetical protein